MKNAIRNGGLALGLIAGAAFLASPAAAGAIHKNGYFGGTWAPIGPSNNRYVKRHYHRHAPGLYAYSEPYYYGPRYRYYAPRYSYYDPGYYGPGVSVGVGVGF